MKFQLVLTVTLFLLVVASGHAAAQANAGQIEQTPTPFQQAMAAAAQGDVEQAVAILTDAAAAGDFEAQVTLAGQYAGAANNLLVAADFPRARSWIQKAFAQKDKAIAARLDEQAWRIGIAIRDGVLPSADANLLYDGARDASKHKKDPGEALKWFEIAAQFGNVQIIRQIGGIYAQGVGVKKNNAIAAQWFAKIADQESDAELWLGKYNLQEQNLQKAMYWLDRYYLNEEEKQSHETEYDKALHYFYGLVLPNSPAGATSIGINHRLTPNPIMAAHLASDDIIYPIVFYRHYQHTQSNKDFVLRVHLNDIADERKIVKAFERDWHRQVDSNKWINGRKVLVTTEHTHGEELVIMAPINSHIIVDAQMQDGKGGDAGDIEILKTALRAVDIDRLVAAVDGHGYYKKDSNGNIYKPRSANALLHP